MVRRGRLVLWQLLRMAGDLAVALLAMRLVFWVRIHVDLPLTLDRLPSDRIQYLTVASFLVALSQNVLLYFFGFYEPPRPRLPLETLRPLLAATTVQWLLLMGYFYLSIQTFPRSVLVLFLPLNIALVFLWRVFLDRLLRLPQRRVAIVGVNAAAQELVRAIHREHWLGLQVVGYVPAPATNPPAEQCELGACLGTVADLPPLLADGVIDDIILAEEADNWKIELVDRLSRIGARRGSVLVLPNPYESLIGRMRYRSIHDTPLIELVGEREWRVNRPAKRLLDVVIASVLLVLATPILALCALAVRLSSPGPALYRQQRIGQDQQLFTLLKLRTMFTNAEAESGERMAEVDDPRRTAVGRVLRRLRIDELPQLLNVLAGSMSLVGPRPERPGFVKRYLEEIPGYVERFSIPPGVTGLAQINGHYHTSPQTKLRYDLAYLANWSMWLDLSLLLRTIRIVLTSRGT